MAGMAKKNPLALRRSLQYPTNGGVCALIRCDRGNNGAATSTTTLNISGPRIRKISPGIRLMQKYAIGVPGNCSVMGMVGLNTGNRFSFVFVFVFIQQTETSVSVSGELFPASALVHREPADSVTTDRRHGNAIWLTLQGCVKKGDPRPPPPNPPSKTATRPIRHGAEPSPQIVTKRRWKCPRWGLTGQRSLGRSWEPIMGA